MITAKGGATEWIHWQSGTAQLLPRLIARRTRGPLFLTDRKAPAGTPTLDVCPETGRARLSYRRAEEIFEENTRLLANPLASPDHVEDLDGWTLHRLRHSALTHDAEYGTSTPMLLAGPAMPPSAPWSGTPVPASTQSPGISRSATPPHVAGTGSGRGSTLHCGSEIGDRGLVDLRKATQPFQLVIREYTGCHRELPPQPLACGPSRHIGGLPHCMVNDPAPPQGTAQWKLLIPP
ncbi:hypothetical protein [Streptomyces wedmorensis]